MLATMTRPVTLIIALLLALIAAGAVTTVLSWPEQAPASVDQTVEEGRGGGLNLYT